MNNNNAQWESTWINALISWMYPSFAMLKVLQGYQ